MSTIIEVNESILGEFAHREDAEAVADALIAKGWPVLYTEDSKPTWTFESLADYRRFGRDYEAAVDALSRAGSLQIRWGCDCKEMQDEPCPHGDDPRKDVPRPEELPLEELWGWALRKAMEKHYPGLQDAIDCYINALYGALAFGVMLEEKTGVASASGLWLRRRWENRNDSGGGLRTYDRHLEEFAQLVDHASHDAYFSELIARTAGSIDNLESCGECEGFKGLDCRCKARA